MTKVIEGFSAPRASVRSILDAKHGFDVTFSLVVLAYVVQAFFLVLIAQTLFPVPSDAQPSVSPLMFHIFNLFVQFFIFCLMTGVVFWVGRLFGGTGKLEDTMLGLAWYLFVTSFLSPFFFFGVSSVMAESESALSVLLLFGSMAIGLWVLANCIAEIHGFRSAWRVLSVMLGLLFGASLLMSLAVVRPS